MSPINKPFDRLAKELADDAMDLLLRSMKLVPDGAKVALRPLRPETSPPVRMVDGLGALAIEDGHEFIFHVEFCVSFHQEVLVSMACYGGSLVCQYRPLRVDSVLVLLDRHRPAGLLPAVSEFVSHGTEIRHPFRAIRLWELAPEPMLASPDLRFVPWAVLMNSTDQQVRDVATRVRLARDEEITARFLTLGALRYDRNVLEQLLGGVNMGLMEALLEGSSLVQDLCDRKGKESMERGMARGLQEGREQGIQQGIQQGMEQGLEKGRQTEARRLLRQALAHRFPGLETEPALETIADTAALERIFLATLTADRTVLEQLIREAAC